MQNFRKSPFEDNDVYLEFRDLPYCLILYFPKSIFRQFFLILFVQNFRKSPFEDNDVYLEFCDLPYCFILYSPKSIFQKECWHF